MVGEIRTVDKVAEPAATPVDEAAADGRVTDPRPLRGRAQRLLDVVRAHPLLVVALGASMVALGHAIWIWSHRTLGGYDPDEAGYLAAALRFERTASTLDPRSLVRTVGATGNGITVPLLSGPFLVLGPRDPRTAMMLHPALLVFTAVATAGITRRLAGPLAAISAGMAVAVLPTMSTATQSYWYGLGSAACLAGALWALLASDRATNRRIWWFGVGVGMMCLSRTMTLGFVPAALVAGLVVAGRDTRALRRLGASVGVAALVAAPWYVANRESIFGYLLSYGYGPRAAKFGDGDVLGRTAFRIERYRVALGDTVFAALWISALCVALLVGWRLWRRSKLVGRAVVLAELPSWRAGLAVGAAFVTGTAALVSTSNNGVWFELPMVTLLVALLVAIVSAGPVWFSVLLALALVVPSARSLAAHWWIVPYQAGGPTAHYEYGFEQYDERFGPGRRDEHGAAADDWAALYRDVLDTIRPERTGDDDPVFTLSGNMQLFNTNSLVLVGELSGWSPRLHVPETVRDAGERAEDLTATVDHGGRTVERVLLLARHDRTLFTPDEEVDSFARQAREVGWRVSDVLRMPGGGEVQVLRHPDR